MPVFCCLWGCGHGAERRVHHIHRPGAAVGLGWRSPAERRVWPLGRVEADPLADDAPGLEAVGERMQTDGLVFERTPQPLDKDVVHAPAPAVHRDLDAGGLQVPGEGAARELALPWSVLKIFGGPWRASAASRASTQKPASRVFDSRQASTCRLAQSMIAALVHGSLAAFR